jgi:hypothetical protein
MRLVPAMQLRSQRITICKEIPVIPINKVVVMKRIIRKRRADEEERHKGSLTQKVEARTNKPCQLIFRPEKRTYKTEMAPLLGTKLVRH